MNTNIYHIPNKKREIILVIAGNHQQFTDFCENLMDEYNETEKWAGIDFVYYSSSDSIRGLKFNDYYCTGTYYQRKDIDWGILFASMKSSKYEHE